MPLGEEALAWLEEYEHSEIAGVSEFIRRLLVLSDMEEFYPKLKEETERVMLAMRSLGVTLGIL